MDTFTTNGGRGDKNHRNRKRLSKTDIGIPQDFVHVATVRSPTKTEVNFNDALISEFLQRAEVSAAALSDPETQQCIKEFIQKVGLDAIHREICQTKAEVTPVNISENEHCDIHHTDEGEIDSSKIQSNDNSSFEFLSDHDIEITSEIDDVFTESNISIASPTTPLQKDSEVQPKHSTKGACESQSQSESDELPKSPNPNYSDHFQEPDTVNEATTPRKKSHHDNFLRELKEAIKKRNIRIKKRDDDEMKRSEEGWSKWNSPKKSKSYQSFSPLDSPPAKPTRIVHTLWDLTSDSHYNSESDIHDENACEMKDVDSPDGRKLSPNSVKLPLTKRTGAITKMASSEKIGDKKFLPSPEESCKDFKISTSTEVNEDGNVQKMEQDESSKENIQAESANQLVSDSINEEISKREENDSETPGGTEDSKNELNKENSSQKKNISLWFNRKNPNKAVNKSILGGLATEEKKASSAEKGKGNDSNMNEPSNNTGEEKKMLSIFSSLTKKKQTQEELPLNVGNDKVTVEEEKEQPKSKTVSSKKFRLFGSSEKLIDHEKKDKENMKEEEFQRTDTPPNQNDKSIAVTHTPVGEMESSTEATENSNEQRNNIKSQDLPMETQTLNTEEDEEIKKDDTNLTKSKSKSTSMKNLFFSSGKQSKQKAEKNKEEDPTLEKKEFENTPSTESICKDDENEAVNKKRSGIMNLLFTPPEKRSKQKDEKAKQNSERKDKKNEKDTEITSNEAEFFVEIPLSDSAAECQEGVKEQESSPMLEDEVNTVGDTNTPSNEESRNMSPKKAKTSSKMKFLFSSGKQSRNKPEESKVEAPKVEQLIVNEKDVESIREEDRYGSWDKSKHSAFVNLLFAPPERHVKKPKSKEKVPDNEGQEGLYTVADNQNEDMLHIESKESSSDKKESLVEKTSSKSNAELTNEAKQEEKQDAIVEEGPNPINDNQCEKIVSKEEKEISENEDLRESSTKMHSPENIEELNNDGEQDIKVREEFMTEVSQDKESKGITESFENRIECPIEIISSENTNEAIKEVNQDSKPVEMVPVIIVTQDEECTSEQEEEILRKKEEISSEMGSGENVIDLKDKNDPQEAPIVKNESNSSITMTEEASRMVESKEFLMDSKEFITEITKCFDEIKDEVKHEELSEEKPDLELRECSINNENSGTIISTSTTVSEDTICVTYTTGDHSKPKIDDEKDIMVKDLPVTATFEEMNNEGEANNVSTKEKRFSGIIDSLFSRTEKHVKPKKDKKRQDSSENEKHCEDSMLQSDESKDKEESANKIESTENVIEFTDKGQPPVVIEDQPIIDTPSDEAPNLGKEMDTSLGTSSSRMQTLFGSTGKHSKPKKNLKQENISKKGEISGMAVAANEDIKNEEVNSLDKAKSSSMRKLLFGKRPKQKYEAHRDLPTASALDDEGNMDKDIKNPAIDNKASSIEISPATYEKPTDIMHEMKEQDGPAIAVEVQEEISENNTPIQEEKDAKTKRRKTPASGKAGFFSLPDRRGRMRNEIKKQEADMSEEQPQSALKEIKQEEKDFTQGNSNKPKKGGLISSLDRRKKRVKHEARMPEVCLETEEISKPGNVESTSSEKERPSPSDTETPRNAIEDFSNERAVDVGEIGDNQHKPKSDSKEDLLKSSSYPRRKGKTRTEIKKEDITLQKDMRHTTHVTWDPIKKNLVLHYTDNEGLRRILLEENLCKEAPAPRQRRHSYSMAMDEIDAEIFEEIPRASIQSYSSVTANSKSSGKSRRRVPKARPRSEIVRGNQPLTEL